MSEEGVAFRQIAQAMARQLDIPTASVARADAADHFGFLGHFVSLDCPTTAAMTRQLLRWKPTGPRLLEDLDEGHYFRSE